MPNQVKHGLQRGFTLIELLIVVIILAILAAIVIPQFSNSTRDAQEATMDSNLAALRSAIELYRAQHNGRYPGATATSGGTGCTGTGAVAGTAAINTPASLIAQLTNASTAAGATCSLADTANYRFGPYLRGTTLPAEPITPSSAVVVSFTGAALPPTVTGTTGGYLYDTVSGQIVINSTALDIRGTAGSGYNTH